MVSWYYVKGSERVGPVEESELEELVLNGQLDHESYVWRKGFENWVQMASVQELSHILNAKTDIENVEVESDYNVDDQVEDQKEQHNLSSNIGPLRKRVIEWDNLDEYDRIISVKIGIDRGCKEQEYGPYNIQEIQRAFKENRINEKTLIFIPGMDDWEFLGDLPIYAQLTPLPPKIEDQDRRRNNRKPFVARILFHDNEEVYEGVCRDVSEGGLQVLVSDFPGDIGEEVSINVHPDNSEYGFVAKGEIVRVLEGRHGFSLKFKGLAEEAHDAILKYLEKH